MDYSGDLRNTVARSFEIFSKVRSWPLFQHPAMIYGIASLLSKRTQRVALRSIALREALALLKRESDVVVVCPKRFLMPQRLAKTQSALVNYVNVTDVIHQICSEKGLTCRTCRKEEVVTRYAESKSGKIIFSHHTFDDQDFDLLRQLGHDVFHFKTGDLPRTILFDRNGFSGWSSLASSEIGDLPLHQISQRQANLFFEESKQSIIEGNLSKYEQPTTNDLIDLPDHFVLIALQTIDDVVQKMAFIPMLEMALWVVNRFRGGSVSVVIKRHPRCRDEKVKTVIERLASENENVSISDGSIHDLLSRADAVFTVNSGVGSEALIHELPVYCFGASDYSAVAHCVRSHDAFIKLTSPLRPKCSPEVLRKFYYFYRNLYQTSGRSDLKLRLQSCIEAHVRGDHTVCLGIDNSSERK